MTEAPGTRRPAIPVLLGQLWWAAALAGCGGAADVAGAAVDEGPPVELVATSPAVLDLCAAELARTYCQPADALAAAQACNARVATAGAAPCDPARGCLVPYAPKRAGACSPGTTYPAADQCADPVPDNCAFYRACLEAGQPCGASGYALSFGEPLCYEFIDHRGDFSADGQKWLQSVRTCLQQALAAEMATPVTTCDGLADAAFASHTHCYTVPDHSFCALAPADVAALEAIVIPYIDDPRVGAQIGAVAAICAAQKP